jgi:maltose alpha-D-glucosyltransferase/alpha-amylase
MQWSAERHGGFTLSDTPVLPPISGGPYGFAHINVAEQRRDPGSLLNWTERILRMRKEVPEIGWGTPTLLRTGTNEVLAIRYDWRGNAALFIHNFGATPREIRLTPGAEGTHDSLLVNLLADGNSAAADDGKHCILLEPYGYRWYRVGGLDYLLRRREV